MNSTEPRIIAKTDDYLVIEKPSGLLSHPSSPDKPEPSLLDFLAKHAPETKEVGDPIRPGLIHRLDKDVSGLLVVARTQRMYDHLKHQFQEHTIEKHYTALVHGNIHKDTGEIKFRIARSTGGKRMAARPEDEEGREALTEFTVLERLVGSTLLDVQIHTGRTHQIRAHFHGYGNPIIGDPLYKQKSTKLKRAPSRIFLHSSKLGFTDLENVHQDFLSPLPQELVDFLNTLSPKK